MTSKEAARYQLKQLKGKPLRDKISHILIYYWQLIVVVLVVVLLLLSQVVRRVTQKENVLSVICVNTLSESSSVDTFVSELGAYLNIDTDNQKVSINTGIAFSETDIAEAYQSMEKIMGLAVAQEVDVISGDINTVLFLAYSEFFCDISTMLSEEQMEKYKDSMIYLDNSLLQNVDQINEPFVYPDPMKPDEMAEPIPIAIQIPCTSSFAEVFYPYMESQLCVGVLENSDDATIVTAFLDYILTVLKDK